MFSLRKTYFEPASTYRLHGCGQIHQDTAEECLSGWRMQNRQLVSESHHQVTQQLIEAAEGEVTLALYYHGGSDLGRFRKFTPESVFRTPDSMGTYVTGFCHLRKAHRVLRTDRISLA